MTAGTCTDTDTLSLRVLARTDARRRHRRRGPGSGSRTPAGHLPDGRAAAATGAGLRRPGDPRSAVPAASLEWSTALLDGRLTTHGPNLLRSTEQPFRVSTMRSAAVSDLTARARIRDAAIRRFGADGFAAPVRAIAAEAGVSPGLVIHHFGSKDGLRAVCDEHVLRLIREAETEAFTASAPGDLLGHLAELDRYAPVVGYLVQAVLAGGDLAVTLLERMTRDAERYLADAVAAGRIRPSRDPSRRAAFLVDIGMGAVLSFVRRHPPVDGDYRATLRAYASANSLPALELYTEGLLTDATVLDAYLAIDDPPPGSE
ncbi:TetR/AcrR family transcriptional regulator [Geodermatophilus maliterrae]|uniref:TetR family transcriptional regulator n=1 Tax=Geodermatophilus maliterrae TaxID=3162531 RepID=A0ABV3XIC7_9ACTN